MRKPIRLLAVMLLVCLALSGMSAHALYNNELFQDVPGDAWYCEAAYYANDHGLMQGTADYSFSPNLTTTRGMVVTILHRIEDEPRLSGKAFSDVAADKWYAPAVAWASANGIVDGYTNDKFGPNDPITREQMAAILYRYAKYRQLDVSGKAALDRYADAGAISAYASDAMAWANAQGLINGVTASTLVPKGSATRAQVATIFMRFNEQFMDPPRPDDPNAVWLLTSIDKEVGGRHSVTVFWHDQEGYYTTARTPAEGTVTEIFTTHPTNDKAATTEQTRVNGQWMTTVDYDEAGRLLREYDHTTDEQTVYSYDLNGNPTGAVFYSPKSGFQSGIVYWLRYALNPNGSVRSITRWDNVSDTYIALPDTMVVSDADAVFHSGEYRYYDADGNLVRVTGANAAGMPIDAGWESTYAYDSEGRRIRETYTDADGTQTTTCAYDEWDHLVKMVVTDRGSTTTYTYTYKAFVF